MCAGRFVCFHINLVLFGIFCSIHLTIFMIMRQQEPGAFELIECLPQLPGCINFITKVGAAESLGIQTIRYLFNLLQMQADYPFFSP